MSKIQVSVVISERDEGHNNIFTIHSIINDLETFLKPDEWEIILVENCSSDKESWQYVIERGLYFHRNVRLLFDPIAGNVTARNKGAKIAKGKYLFFSDSHMSFKVGSFKAMVDCIEKTNGIVHPAVQWMGGYEPSDPSYQYTIKMGEKIWGTWNRSMVSATEPFTIPVCGHCCLGMKREQFLDFGGYNDWFRCYGGGELYLDLKWWMMGYWVSSVPTAIGYHLSAGRGYSFVQDDLIHNMMLMAYALGADAFAERVYLRYLNKVGVDTKKLNKMKEDAILESTDDVKNLHPRFRMTFMEMLKNKPWDVVNDVSHGVHASLMGVYQNWVEELKGEAKQIYENSELQKELNETIQRDFKSIIYKDSE